jgi:hypothetical protein
MIEKTKYSIDTKLLHEAINQLPDIDFKLTINQPRGRFFYDPWEIKPNFKNTIWDIILQSLPNEIGEARLIKLMPGVCYWSHADIDDRYHLQILGDKSFLVDIDSETLYNTNDLGRWYDMNAGQRHSAVNFGEIPRIQFVVRKLLKKNSFLDGVFISIEENDNISEKNSRYVFDHILSPWLNTSCKQGHIKDVNLIGTKMTFVLDNTQLITFKNLIHSTKLIVTYEYC